MTISEILFSALQTQLELETVDRPRRRYYRKLDVEDLYCLQEKYLKRVAARLNTLSAVAICTKPSADLCLLTLRLVFSAIVFS